MDSIESPGRSRLVSGNGFRSGSDTSICDDMRGNRLFIYNDGLKEGVSIKRAVDYQDYPAALSACAAK